MTNPSMSNPHHDVLSSEPTDEAGKQRLVDEIKNRAKGAFGSKDLPNAEILYSRAIELLPKTDHLLYSNRAAVRLQMGKNFDALADATECVKIDKDFVKGWYRKITALHRLKKFSDAIKCCDEAPQNDEIEKLKKEIVKDWEVDRKEKAEFNEEANKADPDLPKPEPTRMPTSKKQEDEPSAKKGKPAAQELRGYKKTADGKTTSYFHTDISAEAKALIGDCAPKKIETPVESEGSTGAKENLGSAWNAAGTFEQKAYTQWFNERLMRQVDGTKHVLPNGTECKLSVSTVLGDATWAQARGKVKCIQDIGLKTKFKFTMESGAKGEGTLTLEADGCDDYDDVIEVDSGSSTEAGPIIQKYVKSAKQGLQPHLRKILADLVEEFRAIKA